MFLKCRSLHFFWNLVFGIFDLNEFPSSIKDWFGIWRSRNIQADIRIYWDSLMLAYIWVIWKERNNRIFENVFNNHNFLFNSILFFVDFWTGNLQIPKKSKTSSANLISVGTRFMLGASRAQASLLPNLLPSSDLLGGDADASGRARAARTSAELSSPSIIGQVGRSSNRFGHQVITYVRRHR